MNHSTNTIFSLVVSFAVAGCSSNPYRTHEGGMLDDKVTAQRVEAELGRSGSEFKGVHVQVRNGVVALNGTVTSPEVRSRAEEITRSLDRVKGLEDNLQVR